MGLLERLARLDPRRKLRLEFEKARSLAEARAEERDAYQRHRDQALAERDEFLRQRDVAIGERNEILRQRDVAIGERNEILRQRDVAIGERKELRRQLDEALGERNEFIEQLGAALHERDNLRWRLAAHPTKPTEHHARCLSIARENFASALADPKDDLPDAGSRWGTIAAYCRTTIPTFETAADVVHHAQCPVGHGGFEARLIGQELHDRIAMHERILTEHIPIAVNHLSSFREPEISHPNTIIQHDGRPVSAPLSTHTIFYFNVVTRVPTVEAICEIGGGYGAPARLWMINSYKRPRLYAIVDLPESLFFAEVYLRTTYDFDLVRYVQPGEQIETRSLPIGAILLCPITRREALKSIRFSVLLNTLSMQEMTDAYVAFYRDWLAEQPAEYFYSFNYFLRPADRRDESPNLFAPRLSKDWEIQWSRPGNDFANVLARRLPPEMIASRNNAAFEQDFRRPLTPDSTFRLLHAADTSADSRFAYRLMNAMSEDFVHCPKEIAFLAYRIRELERQQKRLSESELEHVERVIGEFASKVAAKGDPAVPEHMRQLQGELYNPSAARP
jgi:putative sugar O-methyltransferase